jgi:hypothetical protein
MDVYTGNVAAPRRVPLALALRLLFGGGSAQFGWIFFGFGLIFVWAFGLQSEATTFWKFLGPLRTAPGIVTSVDETGFSEGGGDSDPGVPVFAVSYYFTPDAGLQRVEGTSFVTGSHPKPGETVEVEYQGSRPQASRIAGMRSAPVSAVAIIVVIFPLVGFFFWFTRLRKGLRAIRLLLTGVPAVAVLREVANTNISVNDAPLFGVTYAFTTASGDVVETRYRTTDPPQTGQGAVAQADVLRANEAVVLYDPANPARNFLTREMSDELIVGVQGEITDLKPGRGWASTVLPAITLLGHGAYLLLRLLH